MMAWFATFAPPNSEGQTHQVSSDELEPKISAKNQRRETESTARLSGLCSPAKVALFLQIACALAHHKLSSLAASE